MTPPRSLFSSLRSVRRERRSRKQTDSSTATEEFLPTSSRSCASAFYSHPPTTISLDQLKQGGQRPKAIAVDTCQEEKTPASSSESNKPPSLFSLPTVQEEDVERRAGCCYAGKPKWSARQVVIFKVLLGLAILGIAVMLGVVISITVGNGHIVSIFS